MGAPPGNHKVSEITFPVFLHVYKDYNKLQDIKYFSSKDGKQKRESNKLIN